MVGPLNSLTAGSLIPDGARSLLIHPPEVSVKSTSAEVCACLQRVFDSFMSSLKPDEEVGVALASFGVTHQVRVSEVVALKSNLILISGYEGELPVSLVQHVSQLNFLLIPLKIEPEAEEPRRVIGFRSE